MKAIFALLLGFALLSTSLSQKEKKPWTEWSRKEAENILSKSGWGQMQTDTDTDEMFFRPTHASPRAPNAAERTVEGATRGGVDSMPFHSVGITTGRSHHDWGSPGPRWRPVSP